MPTTRKPAPPALRAKKQPAQQRGVHTYERILEVAATLLAEVGVERLSTNQICQRAGLTPPALYQFFPNKYAVLCELGERLMRAQNERVGHWISVPLLCGPERDLQAALAALLVDTCEVTRGFPGGAWVLRALHAVPTLEQVRLTSHRAVAGVLQQHMAQALPQAPADTLQLFARTAVELVYATVEMLCDEPLPAQAVAQMVARMLTTQWHSLRAQYSP